MTTRFLVSGQVQGVGFRWFVARLEELLRAGPAHAWVERLERQDDVDETVSSRSFDIR